MYNHQPRFYDTAPACRVKKYPGGYYSVGPDRCDWPRADNNLYEYGLIFNHLDMQGPDAARDLAKVHPALAFAYAVCMIEMVDDKEIIDTILKSPWYTLMYIGLRYPKTKGVHPWSEALEVILKCPVTSMAYEMCIFNMHWPEAEESIAGHLHAAVSHAVYTGARFYLAEPLIATNGVMSVVYASKVIRGAFDLGEEAIYRDAPRDMIEEYEGFQATMYNLYGPEV